jgi:hypothetical protein
MGKLVSGGSRVVGGPSRVAHELELSGASESIRGAKQWLTRHVKAGRPYSPIPDQAAFAANLDLQAARRAPSFDKFYREVVRLFRDASALSP